MLSKTLGFVTGGLSYETKAKIAVGVAENLSLIGGIMSSVVITTVILVLLL